MTARNRLIAEAPSAFASADHRVIDAVRTAGSPVTSLGATA